MYNPCRWQSSTLLAGQKYEGNRRGVETDALEAGREGWKLRSFLPILYYFFGGNFLIQQNASNLEHLPSGDIFFLGLKG